MSTLAAVNLKHASSASNNIVLNSSGGATVSGALVGAGLDLITPTSIAYSGGSASASGGAVSFSGVSSVSLNGVFQAGYENYRLLIISTNSTAAPFYMRMRGSGTDDSSANYDWAQNFVASTTTAGGEDQQNQTFWAPTSANARTVRRMSFDIFNPFTSTATFLIGMEGESSGTASGVSNFAGAHQVGSSYDGITLYTSSGSIAGSIRVYGYRNS